MVCEDLLNVVVQFTCTMNASDTAKLQWESPITECIGRKYAKNGFALIKIGLMPYVNLFASKVFVQCLISSCKLCGYIHRWE